MEKEILEELKEIKKLLQVIASNQEQREEIINGKKILLTIDEMLQKENKIRNRNNHSEKTEPTPKKRPNADRLEKISLQKKFVISQVGQKKFEETMDALNDLSQTIQVDPFMLSEIAEFFLLEATLPTLRD